MANPTSAQVPALKPHHLERIRNGLGRKPAELEQSFLAALYASQESQHPFEEELGPLSPVVQPELSGLVLGSESRHDPVKRSARRDCLVPGAVLLGRFKSVLSTFILSRQDTPHRIPPQTARHGDLYLIITGQKLPGLMSVLAGRPWVYASCCVNRKGLGNALVSIASKEGCGIRLRITRRADITRYGSNREEGILVVVQEGFGRQFLQLCRSSGLQTGKLGSIVAGHQVSLVCRGKKLFSLPMSILAPEEPVVPLKNLPTRQETVVAPVRPAEPKNYSRVLRKLLDAYWKDPKIRITPASARRGPARAHFALDGQQVGVSLWDRQQFCTLNPRLGGRIAVANTARQLACAGIKPEGVAIIIHGGKADKEHNQWRRHEVMMGLREACASLDIAVLDRKLTRGDTDWGAPGVEICLIGRGPESDFSRRPPFLDQGDFISLLGSHRGELGGSFYLQIIHGRMEGTPPAVDLSMEARLQEVLLLGIKTGLIKSASNVGTGGMALTLAECLATSPPDIGARIHISLKLRNDELLFGETQGLVLITISEEELMEFERICMTIGVPSTTIGRVTDTGRFTFNDLINVSRRELEA